MIPSGQPDASEALEGQLARASEANTDSDPTQRSNDLPTNQGDPLVTARIFQCALCSHVLRSIVNLPCGNCVCTPCLPTTYIRSGIQRTWPGLPERREAFQCTCCQQEHARGDCRLDYLSMQAVRKTQSLVNKIAAVETEDAQKLVVAFKDIGLDPTLVDSDVDSYLPNAERDGEQIGPVDRIEMLLRREMDCAICQCLLYNPWTTPCGHTFCQQCIHRACAIAPLCPTCRTPLSTQTTDKRTNSPNQFVVRLTTYFWADELETRKAALNLESVYPPDGSGLDTPIFSCTVSFPRMPTFLHVFERKYRHMMTRVWGEGNGTKYFGMVLPNETGIGWVGVHLRIVYFELYPDGRSVVEGHGTSRFRVKRWDYHRDGYIVADVEDLDDVSLYEEENLEAREIGDAAPPTDIQRVTVEDLEHMSTRELMQLAYDIIQNISSGAPQWMNNRILALYGQCPNDPNLFPWWLGSIIPVHEHEKERLLMQTTVRARMKICCRWLLEWRIMRRSWLPQQCLVM